MDKLQTVLTALLVVIGTGILWELNTISQENRESRKGFAVENAALKAESAANDAKEKEEAKATEKALAMHNAGRRGKYEAMLQSAEISGGQHAKDVAHIELALLDGEITKDEALRELIALR